MKVNPSSLTIRIPIELKEKIQNLANNQGVSLNQFALYTFTKEVVAMETNNFFRKRIENKKTILEKFDIFNENRKTKTKKVLPVWDKL